MVVLGKFVSNTNYAVCCACVWRNAQSVGQSVTNRHRLINMRQIVMMTTMMMMMMVVEVATGNGA